MTLATARRALANGDGSEVQLLGGARVNRAATGNEEAIEFRSEFLHVFLNTERLRSHLPVVVTQGTTEVRAASMNYDNLARVVEFKGRAQRDASRPKKRGEMNGGPLVFITGASSGIGQALAPRFHGAGYRLALVARRGDEVARWAEAPASTPALRRLRRRRARRRRDHRRRRACIAAQGVPDVVIANAGISVGIDTADRRPRGDARHARDQQPRHGRDVPAVRRGDARAPLRRLVGIASVAGIRGLPGHGAYCASKAAVISYCEACAASCGRRASRS